MHKVKLASKSAETEWLQDYESYIYLLCELATHEEERNVDGTSPNQHIESGIHRRGNKSKGETSGEHVASEEQ